MDEPIGRGCITSEELAAWLKLVERDILKTDSSNSTAPTELSDPPGSSRTTLAIVATVAGSITFAWLTFLIWLAFKGVSLL
jgi:hypothetical protein